MTHSFGADEGSDLLRVLSVAHHPAVAHDNGVNVSVHFRVHKGDVVKQVNATVLDGLDRSWAAAEDSCNAKEVSLTFRESIFQTASTGFLAHLRSSAGGSGPAPASHSFLGRDPYVPSSTPPTRGSSCHRWGGIRKRH